MTSQLEKAENFLECIASREFETLEDAVRFAESYFKLKKQDVTTPVTR